MKLLLVDTTTNVVMAASTDGLLISTGKFVCRNTHIQGCFPGEQSYNLLTYEYIRDNFIKFTRDRRLQSVNITDQNTTTVINLHKHKIDALRMLVNFCRYEHGRQQNLIDYSDARNITKSPLLEEYSSIRGLDPQECRKELDLKINTTSVAVAKIQAHLDKFASELQQAVSISEIHSIVSNMKKDFFNISL